MRPISIIRLPRVARGFSAILAAALLAIGAPAQTLYWDISGKTAGAGGTTPAGTWSTGAANKTWSTSSAGTSSTQAWTSGGDAIFSAGTDATGAYTVTVSGTQNVSSITVQEGSPTLGSGIVNFSDSSPDILAASGSTLTFSSAPTSSTGNLNVGSASFTGTTVFASDLSLAGTVTLAGGTLRLGGSSYTFGTLNITGDSTIDFAGTTTLNLTNFSVSTGVNLTIINWAAAADHFYTANWSGATPDLFNNLGAAPMSQVTFTGFTSSQTGWDSFNHEIRPNVPEPSAYGALLLGLLTALFARRRHRRA